jgi:hypothetical protein
LVGAVCALLAAVIIGTGAFGRTASASTAPAVTLTPAGPYVDQQTITVSVGPNDLFPPNQSVKIIECAVGATSDAQCDGNTQNADTIVSAADGSFSYDAMQVWVLPNAALGEPAGNHPVCNATTACDFYVGLNQNDFTQPKLFSDTFTVGAVTTTTTVGSTTTTTVPATTTTTVGSTKTTTTVPSTTTTTTVASTTTTTNGTTTTTGVPATTTTTGVPATTTTTTGVPATTTTTGVPATTTTTRVAATTTTTGVLATTTTSVAATTTTTSGPAITVASTVASGQPLAISGTGFPANASLQIQLASTPSTIGTVSADASGAFQTTVTIPATTEPGTHTITVGEASGADQVQATITVTAASTSGSTTSTTVAGALGLTGSDARRSLAIALGLLGLGLLLLAAGWPGSSRLPRPFRRVG